MRPERALDIGCGTGALLRALSQRFPDVRLVGVDPAAGIVSTARHACPKLSLVQAVAEALPFAGGEFGS